MLINHHRHPIYSPKSFIQRKDFKYREMNSTMTDTSTEVTKTQLAQFCCCMNTQSLFNMQSEILIRFQMRWEDHMNRIGYTVFFDWRFLMPATMTTLALDLNTNNTKKKVMVKISLFSPLSCSWFISLPVSAFIIKARNRYIVLQFLTTNKSSHIHLDIIDIIFFILY